MQRKRYSKDYEFSLPFYFYSGLFLEPPKHGLTMASRKFGPILAHIFTDYPSDIKASFVPPESATGQSLGLLWTRTGFLRSNNSKLSLEEGFPKKLLKFIWPSAKAIISIFEYRPFTQWWKFYYILLHKKYLNQLWQIKYMKQWLIWNQNF